MSYYTVSKPTTIYYTSFALSLLTWKALSDADTKTWAKLKELGLTTWKALSMVRGAVTFYYKVPLVTTTYYEVSV